MTFKNITITMIESNSVDGGAGDSVVKGPAGDSDGEESTLRSRQLRVHNENGGCFLSYKQWYMGSVVQLKAVLNTSGYYCCKIYITSNSKVVIVLGFKYTTIILLRV